MTKHEVTIQEINELDRMLEEKHCYKCKHFYEGFICGFELSANQVEDTIEDIMDRRKDVCTLDKEPFEIRSKIYSNLKR